MKQFALNLCVAIGLVVPSIVLAQTPTQLNPNSPAVVAPVKAITTKPALPVSFRDRPSLFFTSEELELLLKANQGFFEADDPRIEMIGPPNPGPRVLRLAGIVYNSDKDWAIWFNNEQVTPRNVPSLVLGLKVHKDKIDLRWLDRGTNKIINLVLRPHQQYNIDSDTVSVGTK